MPVPEDRWSPRLAAEVRQRRLRKESCQRCAAVVLVTLSGVFFGRWRGRDCVSLSYASVGVPDSRCSRARAERETGVYYAWQRAVHRPGLAGATQNAGAVAGSAREGTGCGRGAMSELGRGREARERRVGPIPTLTSAHPLHALSAAARRTRAPQAPASTESGVPGAREDRNGKGKRHWRMSCGEDMLPSVL